MLELQRLPLAHTLTHTSLCVAALDILHPQVPMARASPLPAHHAVLAGT